MRPGELRLHFTQIGLIDFTEEELFTLPQIGSDGAADRFVCPVPFPFGTASAVLLFLVYLNILIFFPSLSFRFKPNYSVCFVGYMAFLYVSDSFQATVPCGRYRRCFT